MRLFICQHCRNLLYFENRQCQSCGHRLGYMPRRGLLTALEPRDNDWETIAKPKAPVRFCANAEFDACNWLVPAEQPDPLCAACRHNRTIPDLSEPVNLEAWRKLELAMHRLFYTLLKLRLPLADRRQIRHPRRSAGAARPESANRPRQWPDHARPDRGR